MDQKKKKMKASREKAAKWPSEVRLRTKSKGSTFDPKSLSFRVFSEPLIILSTNLFNNGDRLVRNRRKPFLHRYRGTSFLPQSRFGEQKQNQQHQQ